MEFFLEGRFHFFRPLNGKYREMAVACLRALYERLHGPEADYNALFSVDDLRDIFTEVVGPLQVLSTEEGDDPADLEDPRARANAIVRGLMDAGWLEVSQDRAALRHFVRFTRVGKLFADAFIALEHRGLSSRQRNVRNTRNTLHAFLEDQDPFNLIDAQRYAEQVNSDLAEDIIDLHERKSELLQRAAEAGSKAIETYVDFMDAHFMPDIAVRMSSESIERHRADIRAIILRIRHLPKDRLDGVERRLAELAPAEAERRPQGLVNYLLASIDGLVAGACRAKMPELRSALSGFLRRSRMVVSNAYAMASPQRTAVALKALGELPQAEAEMSLTAIGNRILPVPPKLLDPNRIKIAAARKLREIPTDVSEPEETREDRLRALIEERVQMAFSVSVDHMESEIVRQMGSDVSMRASDLQVHDVLTLMTLSHCIETGMIGGKKKRARLSFEPVVDDRGDFVCFTTPFGEHEDYIIRRESTP